MKHSLTGDSPSVPARASQWTRVVASARGSQREGPPGRSPGGEKEPNRWALAFDRVAALRVVGLGRRDRQAHLLAQGAGKKPTNRVCLPARGFHEFLQGGASRTLQQVEDLGRLAALAGAGRLLLRRLGRICAFARFLRRAAPLARLGLGRRNVALLCRGPRLFGGLWLLGRGTGLRVGGLCWNTVHNSFSLGGDYRDPMDHSGSRGLQADFDGSPHWRGLGGGGDFLSQMGAGGGRC